MQNEFLLNERLETAREPENAVLLGHVRDECHLTHVRSTESGDRLVLPQPLHHSTRSAGGLDGNEPLTERLLERIPSDDGWLLLAGDLPLLKCDVAKEGGDEENTFTIGQSGGSEVELAFKQPSVRGPDIGAVEGGGFVGLDVGGDVMSWWVLLLALKGTVQLMDLTLHVDDSVGEVLRDGDIERHGGGDLRDDENERYDTRRRWLAMDRTEPKLM